MVQFLDQCQSVHVGKWHLGLLCVGSGGCTPQARLEQSQDRIAQRPAMARSNRLAESIYKPDLLLLRGARPFKAYLYFICLNNKCFDFNWCYIFGDSSQNLGTGEMRNRRVGQRKSTSTSSGSRQARTKGWLRAKDVAHRAFEKLADIVG